MKYVSVIERRNYRCVYGSGDTGWDVTYLADTFDSESDDLAASKTLKSIGANQRLMHLFAVDHEVPLPKQK